jgi:hypothetical protein
MPMPEAAMVHQVGHQFQQGFSQARWRAQRLRAGINRTATRSSTTRLPIAGPKPAGPPAAPSTAGAAAGATVVGVAAAAGTAGFRFVRDRVVVGGTPVATRQSPVAGGG